MASGRPDYFGTIVAAGKYDDAYTPIALDVDGFITATMKGAYDAGLKTIAVDSSGIMKANLSAQDLDFLTVRPAYGAVDDDIDGKLIADATESVIFTKSGRGVLVGGVVRWWGGSSKARLRVKVVIDTNSICAVYTDDLMDRHITKPNILPTYVIKYDEVNYAYVVGISPGITFESSFAIQIYHELGMNQQVNWELYWALVP